jgi:hypothetical protein
MAAWIAKTVVVQSTVNKMMYLSLRQVLNEEKKWTRRGTLNTQGKRQEPQQRVVEITMPEVQCDRWMPRDDVSKSRYRISYRTKDDCNRNAQKSFYYKLVTKEEALASAMQWRHTELVQKQYI